MFGTITVLSCPSDQSSEVINLPLKVFKPSLPCRHRLADLADRRRHPPVSWTQNVVGEDAALGKSLSGLTGFFAKKHNVSSTNTL